MRKILENAGYIGEGYGYSKQTDNGIKTTHWVTLFGTGGLQMYAYNTHDPEMEKVYDTGFINCTPEQLQALITVLNQH